MKIIVSILLLMLLLPITLNASTEKSSLFEIKVIMGSEIFKDEFKMETMTQNIKFCGGIGIGKGHKLSRFEGNFLISTDLRKSDKDNYYYRFYKFTMPVLYKYKFKAMNSPYIVGGGSASFIIADQTNYYGKPIKGIDNKTYFDYGVLFGAGYEIDLRRLSVTIEGRYYKGIKELDFNSYKFKRSGLYILIGALFW